MPRPIRALISAAALAQNLTVARRHAGDAKVWAVIKANAYGHGIERAARAMAAADGFAVLDFQEAARLRAAGVGKPILMLEGFFQPADLALLTRYRLTPVVHNPEQVEMLKRTPLDGEIFRLTPLARDLEKPALRSRHEPDDPAGRSCLHERAAATDRSL